MSKRDGGVSDFSSPRTQEAQPAAGPLIAQGVPAAAASRAEAYAAGMQGRRQMAAPTKQMPAVGGEPIHIPNLMGAPQPGSPSMTMAQYAAHERPAPVAPQPHVGGIVQPDPNAPVRLDIRPSDVLPEDATKDPRYLQGQGSMYASAQPHLAARYGVIRAGKHIPPQLLAQPATPPAQPGQAPKQSLSAGSLQDLETLAALRTSQQSQLPTDQQSMRASVESSAGAAAQIANAPGDRNVEPVSESDKAKFEKALSNMDEFAFNEYRNALLKDILNNPEQRELIEGRLEPLKLDDLLVKGHIRQKVPINKHFTITLQSFDGELDLALKRLIMEESRSLDVAERYLLDKYSFFGVCAGLHAINDKVYPDFHDAKGNFDDDAFTEKFNRIIKLPLHILASVGVNLFWFDQRVRRLVRAEALGNG